MSLRHTIAGVGLSLSLLIGGTQALANNQEMFAELEQDAQAVRELDLLEPLDITVKTREELRQESIDSMEEDFPIEDTADWNKVLVFLGYIEEGDDMALIYTDLMSEQVLGYYDPTTGAMVVVSTADAEWGATDKSTFVHETVHALQDQHYDLVAIQGTEEEYTDDLYFARTAMIEGDATMAETIYLVQNDMIDQIMEEQSGMDTTAVDEAPFFLTESLYFPYITGAEFIMYFWTEGGWEAVDAIWQNPPTTSEQIIHPEKYEAGEGAIPVAIADPLGTFGADWRLLEYNENGELGTRIFLENGGASSRSATAASEGWGGDATYIITNDEETAMVWTSAWDTEEDATEYFDALTETEIDRLGATRDDLDENTVAFAADGWVGEIHRDGEVVTYYLTQSEGSMEMMLASQVGAEVPAASPVDVEATPEYTPAAVAFWVREV